MPQDDAGAGARLGKLAMPRAEALLPRPRLFARLDAVTEPLLWIDAPGGYGKTALAASWLARRGAARLWYRIDAGDDDPATFLHDLALAAAQHAPGGRPPDWRLPPAPGASPHGHLRRALEQLGGWLPAGSAIVLDNVERLSPAGPLHHGVAEVAELLPHGVTLLALSREPPPPAYARARANRLVARLDWRDLALTDEEAIALADAAAPSPGARLPAAAICALRERTGGWAAGLVLMLERLRDAGVATAQIGPVTDEAVFDYFAAELLDRVSPELRGFLLRTAALPEMTADLAAAATGEARAGELLDALVRGNLFTTAHGVAERSYAYHPLFARFLRQRAAAAVPEAERRALAARAAAGFAARGEIATAVEVLSEAGVWDQVADLIRLHGAELVAAGRHETLAAWLDRLPAAVVAADPWLRLWRGTAWTVRQPERARAELEAAYGGLRAAGDAVGEALAWAAVCESLLLARADMAPLDAWLEALEPTLAERGVAGPPEVAARVLPVLFAALVHRQPDHPRLVSWCREVLDLALRVRDPTARIMIGWHLANYYHWVGDLPQARLITELLRACDREAEPLGPFARSLVLACEGILAWFSQAPEATLRAVAAGLALGEQADMHVWDAVHRAQAVYAYLALGDVGAARRELTTLAPVLASGRHLDVTHYYTLASAVTLAEGDALGATAHGERAVAAAAHAGSPFPRALAGIILALAHVANDELDAVPPLVARAKDLGERMGSRLLCVEAGLVTALAAAAAGAEAEAVTALRPALADAHAVGLQLLPWWRPADKVRVCTLALAHGVAVDDVRAMIRAQHLVADPRAAELDGWPWRVRVSALGPLRVEVDGAPADWGKRGPGRPAELLACLVAHGGQEVPEHRVADCLWPDADGDAAAASLKTTLARLRRVIGCEAVQLSHGCLTLDPARCWVDVFQLTRAAAAVPSASERVRQLYRGDLLADLDAAWVRPRRARLRSAAAAALGGEVWLPPPCGP